MSARSYDAITVAMAVPVVVVLASAALFGLTIRALRLKSKAVVCICRRAACERIHKVRR
jgi:hypothetical protein